MLDRLFNFDNPVMRFLSKLFDLMVLNFLFILCSIPIFTIGASLSALHYACLKMKDVDEGYVFKNFFHSFKVNFKQGTGLWMIFLPFAVLLYLEWRVTSSMTDSSARPAVVMIFVAAVFWYMILCWTFALQSRFVNTVGQTLKNAILLSFAKAPRSVAMILIFAVELIVVIRSPGIVLSYVLLYTLMFGFSVQVLINTQIQYPVILSLMPKEETEEPADDRHFQIDEDADVSVLGYTPLPKEEQERKGIEEDSTKTDSGPVSHPDDI